MEGIKNYFEEQVTQYLELNGSQMLDFDDNELSDIACLALNSLPSRYYRHKIDLSFYTSSEEDARMQEQVNLAVKQAIQKVKTSSRH